MYKFVLEDNNLSFFQDRDDVKRCPICRELLEKWDEDLSPIPIRQRKKKYDISTSSDGIDIVSQNFKALYTRSAMTGLRFKDLDDNAFAIRATEVVSVDPQRTGARFVKQCELCGRFESVVRSGPMVLAPGSVIPPRGFARTDLEFGSGDEKSPNLLCGENVAQILWAAKLKGIVLQKVKV